MTRVRLSVGVGTELVVGVDEGQDFGFLEDAGLPDIRLHDLRHSTSSLAASMGIDPKLTAVVLGHANPSMTVDRYTHNSLTLSRLVADALDRATGGEASPPTGHSADR